MPPLGDKPGNGTDDTSERQLSAPEYVAELGALISELEAAEGGSQSLDIRIHYGFRVLGGHGADVASLLIKEGVSWPTVQATLKEIVPAYSTSLDAALQGEEIVFALRSAKSRRWGAMQRTSSGGEELAWAATEPLARRLAALKSWRAELIKSLDDDENIAGRTTAYRPGSHQADNSGAEEPAAAKKGGPAGVTIDKANPNRDLTRLRDNPERAQHDSQDRSDQEEKDWEILF